MENKTCAAAILAGGLSSRMGGRNKAFLSVGGRAILDRIMDVLGLHFKEILLVTRRPELYEGRPVKVVQDVYSARASLTGIHAGLIHAEAPFVFVTACDSPFIKPDVIRLLLGEIEPASDVIIPAFDGHFEPLCAIYSKRCLPHIEDRLDRDDLKILHFFNEVNVKHISKEKLTAVDPSLQSFFNVNTPAAHRASQDLSTP
ncbi:MAG: molybdenum cofactor guanylyltransferase [Deltaproteobacteria bacterium]|nr:molybdenum cofactor guanylyltransferase [Deltaproteobacteria bacterium]